MHFLGEWRAGCPANFIDRPMAATLYHPSFFAARSSSPDANPSKTLVPKTIYLPYTFRKFKQIAGCLPSKFSASSGKRQFRLLHASEGDTPVKTDVAEKEQINERIAESESSKTSDLLTLLKSYRTAIISKDEKAIKELENHIYSIENERNESARDVLTLSSELKSWKDKYLRLQADFDNFRKRSENERLTTRADAKGEVIKGLLPLVDNFERAKMQIKLETESEKKIDASYQGIYKQFVEIMKILNVSAVTTVGNRFDPSLHEAIAREESEEFEEGVVVEEFRRGFLFEGRLLRPAMVKVSSGPGPGKAGDAGVGCGGQSVDALGGEEGLETPHQPNGQSSAGVDGREKDVSSVGEERAKHAKQSGTAGVGKT